MWTDGSTLDWTNWAAPVGSWPENPNNYLGLESCVENAWAYSMTGGEVNNTWNDRQCEHTSGGGILLGALCKRQGT